MSKLIEYRERLRLQLAGLEKAEEAYGLAKSLHEHLQAQKDGATVQGVGLSLTLANGNTLPVPLPTDANQVMELVLDALSFASQEVLRCWEAIYATGVDAKRHCDEARAKHEAEQNEAANAST